MSQSITCCPVCLRQFNTKRRVPKLIPTCSHTICQDCLVKILHKENPKCPLDNNNSAFDENCLNINAFPTNFLCKDLLKIKGVWDQCEIHNEMKNMICLEEKTLVCHDCVIFGDHKNHHVKQLSDFQETINAKKNELGAISNKLSKGLDGLHFSLTEWECNTRSDIIARFQKLHSILMLKTEELLSRLSEFTYNQRIPFDLALNRFSNIYLEIENKFNELEDIMLSPNIEEILAQNFSTDILQPLDEKLENLNVKCSKEISEFTRILQTRLPLLEDFSIDEPLNQYLEQLSRTSNQFTSEQLTGEMVTITDTELKITRDFDNSKIFIQSSPIKRSYTFTQQELAQIREAHYEFRIEDEHSDDFFIYAQRLLSQFLTSVTSISIQATKSSPRHQEGIYNGRFQFLFFAIFSHPQNLQHIHIEADNISVQNFAPTFLIERVLPQVKNLKSLSLILPHCGIATPLIKALTNANLTNLTKFRLNIAGARSCEEDMIQLLNNIPNVKDLAIALGDTPIGNRTIELFSDKILPSLNNLERFEVGFWNTQITDEAVHKFLMNLPINLKNLVVVLDGTSTTDAGILEFLDVKISLLPNLQLLRLYTSRTQISNEISQKIDQINQQISSRNETSFQ